MKAAKEASHRVPTVAGDLDGLDSLTHEAVALIVFRDVRPLKGVAGFADWRTNGRLSRTLLSEAFCGERGEVLLAPCSGRLGLRRFFLFGAGTAATCTRARLAQVIGEAHAVMHNAGVRKAVLGAPEVPKRPEIQRWFLEIVEELGPDVIECVLVAPRS